MRPRVKICCISSIQEAQQAINMGADALGLVGHMPSGPGILTDETILEIAEIIPPPVATFLLTSKTSAQEIIAHHQRVHTHTIQIVDALAEGTYEEIRKALPGTKLVQVIHVINDQSIAEAIKVAVHVDALLLDSGNPTLAVKELGGTGRTHNWTLSRKIQESVPIPVFLAGGLHPGNVKEAYEAVAPFGIDLCSGVRTDRKLDLHKLEAFFKAVSEI
ncbi:MAG: phosphoribosylanthranilate isomerase [Bacteroidota bacterium]